VVTKDYGRFECEYCGRTRGYPSQLERLHGKLVCKDIKSCDEADKRRAEREGEEE
jgi:hypothetical protein